MMLCKSPLIINGLAVGCARCDFCKINKRREWTARLLLEDQSHEDGCMVTLTYDQDQLNFLETIDANGEFLPTLKKDDVQRFLKRLRIHLARHSFSEYRRLASCIRYFAAGEYGDKSGRPHYHLCLWPLGVRHAEIIRRAWSTFNSSDGTYHPIGHVDVTELNETTMHYVAGYVMKKMTSKDDVRLCGREPEFRIGSRRPALGFKFIQELSSRPPEWLLQDGDVISQIRIGRSSYQVGRLLRAKLRQLVGISDGCTPRLVKERSYQEMRLLSESVILSPEDTKKVALAYNRYGIDRAESEDLRLKILAVNRQKARNAEARYNARLQKYKPRERDL